eukprot:495754_1
MTRQVQKRVRKHAMSYLHSLFKPQYMIVGVASSRHIGQLGRTISFQINEQTNIVPFTSSKINTSPMLSIWFYAKKSAVVDTCILSMCKLLMISCIGKEFFISR